ncbi:murein L,D-transpeptidase YafK [Methylohalomonas lacus]|uniref:Murein L,D-transpeptidase YafK n=1 Tax=Methylohalomonas lacus TaxID=398773 RepID=A0AAE3HHT5_9GAMM|nr:L,D-transpeptidase [Methylohalomonas lacus]MCS3902539.1 murein L,D-transpeptidase YafK [Methylohalomonas lacus]
MRLLIILYLLLILSSPALAQQIAGAAHATSGEYSIEIDKSRSELVVKHENSVIKRYRAATGRGGQGTKRVQGDRKTPIGVYRVVDFKDDSRFHFFMQIDYPNLLDAWYGYKNELIDASEFHEITTAVKNNQKPPQDTALGGQIGIHGIGEMNDEKRAIHARENWTAGCIALTNDEIIELRQYVTIGTPIVIKE